MIKKIIKPDNYNVAYFWQDYTLTISKSLELKYHQDTNFELETIILELDISSIPTLTSYLREARKVIKEILVSAKQIEITTTAEATIPE